VFLIVGRKTKLEVAVTPVGTTILRRLRVGGGQDRRSIGPNLPSVQLSIQMRWAVLSPGQSHEHPQFMTNSSVNSIVDVVPQRKLYFGRVCFLSSQFRIMGVVLLVVLIRYKTYLRQSCSPHISNSCLFLNACRVPALSCI
jgi:hypothetical protein